MKGSGRNFEGLRRASNLKDSAPTIEGRVSSVQKRLRVHGLRLERGKSDLLSCAAHEILYNVFLFCSKVMEKRQKCH